jgi:hypothetical protein
MAAPAYVFTIGYVARQLAIDKVAIEDIAREMAPEDGCLSIINDDFRESITACALFGIYNLKDLLAGR